MKTFLKIVLCCALCSINILVAESIEKIDKNFADSKIGNTDVRFYNAMSAPFEITGFPWKKKGETFYRIPADLTEKDVNKGVLSLARHTSGGVIRFATNSPFIAVRATLRGSDMSHMPRAGSAGFDIFKEDKYIKTLQPQRDECDGARVFERIANTGDSKMRTYCIYLPLYGSVKSIEIGLAPNAKIQAAPSQKIDKPILFYGSSITQGGCASRPANNYTTMLCRAVDAPQINMGFSGSAKGEEAIARAIASLDISVFVYDYDYNAPNAQHLKNTHEKFFNIIRAAKPELPIIMLTSCSWRTDARRDAIKQTFTNAKNRGDKNVYFIDGKNFFSDLDDYATCDGVHPNDLGFYKMYKGVLPTLQKVLKK